jgi:putative holliday junction resolvase
MRWMGIDYGTVRIGVAIGNTTDGIASPIEVVAAQPPARAIDRIKELIGEYGVEGLVVGWPLNMEDSEGPQGEISRAVALVLAETTGLDVRLWDERLSSFEADQKLAGLLTRKKKKARQDAVAAAAILHDFFLAGGPNSNAPRPGEIKEL